MKAFHAIYNQGQIDFLFRFPDELGPTPVLVIFPDPCDPNREDDSDPLPQTKTRPLSRKFEDLPCDSDWFGDG